MSTDLKSQIRAYGSQLVGDQTAITESDITVLVDKVRELPPIPIHVRAKPRIGVTISVAAAVLLIIGVMSVILSGGTADAPPVSDPTPVAVPPVVVPQTVAPSPATPTTTTPATTVAPLSTQTALTSVIWTKHEADVPLGDGYSYAETPVGLLATRNVDTEEPLVYASENGIDWAEVPIPIEARVPISPEVANSDAFELEPTPAGFWLKTTEGLWFADLESWSTGEPTWAKTPAVSSFLDSKGPPPPGTQWSSSTTDRARIGNTTLVTVEWEIAIDYTTLLDLPPEYRDVHHDDLDSCYVKGAPNQLSIRGLDPSGDEVCLGRVTLLSVTDGVTVLNQDGIQVASIDNAVADYDYGSGGPHLRHPSPTRDLYASAGDRWELIRSEDATAQCGQGLDQNATDVIHYLDCGVAMSTSDGVTWMEVSYTATKAALAGHHPLGFSWESTYPWGPDGALEPPTILASNDGETWTEVLRDHALIVEAPGGLVVTRNTEDGGLATEIVVYNGVSASTVQSDWPVSNWPEFLGDVENSLILIDGTDIWIGQIFDG